MKTTSKCPYFHIVFSILYKPLASLEQFQLRTKSAWVCFQLGLDLIAAPKMQLSNFQFSPETPIFSVFFSKFPNLPKLLCCVQATLNEDSSIALYK